MRIAIVQFPGSNCERETMLAVKRAGMNPIEFLWNESTEQLRAFDGYIIVGGFSYEDRSRAGAIAALDPVMQIIKEESKKLKPVLGICNGAQILVETGLVPGIANDKVCMALTDNKRIQNGKLLGTGFYNAWVNIRLSDHYQLNAFTRKLTPQDVLTIPTAHAEGRFVIPPALLTEINANGLNVFQYCDSTGNLIDEFPINPNGSIDNIAAISNRVGNVMAIMPHPERTPNGDAIFASMKEYIARSHKMAVSPLAYYPQEPKIIAYQAPKKAHELIVSLNIADNQALSVENALNRLGMPVKVKRHVHWEIMCPQEDFYKLEASGVLFNHQKETPIQLVESTQKRNLSYLVRAKEDILGQQKKQLLHDHFNLKDIQAVRHSVLWQVTADKALEADIINSHLLFNPYAHDCYYYE